MPKKPQNTFFFGDVSIYCVFLFAESLGIIIKICSFAPVLSENELKKKHNL